MCADGLAKSQDIDVLAPNLAPVYQIFNVRSIWTGEWLPYMATKTFYHAVCATLQTIRESLEVGYAPREEGQRVLRHKEKAYRVLRKVLIEQPEVGDSALLAVLFLGVIEVCGFGSPKWFAFWLMKLAGEIWSLKYLRLAP
jgi:hypothetical protein